MIQSAAPVYFLLFLSFSVAHGQVDSRNFKPLHFEASQNNLYPSSQRFEYQLEDSHLLQIGDLRIDTSQINIEFKKDGSSAISILQWPQALLDSGEVILTDSAGKALARKNFQRSALTPTKDTKDDVDSDENRDSLTQFQWEDLPSDILSRLRNTAFFRFCLTKQDGNTSIILCSPESFFKKDSQNLEIGTRSPYRESKIEINGEAVGPKGVIYLNDNSETVRFKASTANGAFVELNTRSQKVTFEDIIMINDQGKILITAQGADPINLKRIRRLDRNRWQTILTGQRPVLYMRGEGNIPLRQDFEVKGPLPRSSDRVYISKTTPEAVYSKELKIEGINPEKRSLQVPAGYNQARIEVQGEKFFYTLENLKPNTSNRYELVVEPEKFIAHYDVRRGYARSLDGGLTWSDGKEFLFKGQLRWWFESLLNMSASSQQLRWGSGLFYSKSMESNNDWTQLNARIYWRFEKGLQRVDDTWGLVADYWNIDQIDSQASLLGFGTFYSKQPPLFLTSWMDWLEIELLIHFMPLSSDTPIDQNTELSIKALKKIRHDWHFYYGGGFNSINGASQSRSQGKVDIGLSWIF